MSGSTRPTDLAAANTRSNRRLDQLERRLGRLEQAFKPEVTFSHDGALSASASTLWRRREKGRLINVVGSLVTPGTTTTEVSIHKNGHEVGILRIQGGQTYGQLPLSVPFAPEDTLQDLIITPGSGAGGLTVQHRWAAAAS